jgi:hypothetical protein
MVKHPTESNQKAIAVFSWGYLHPRALWISGKDSGPSSPSHQLRRRRCRKGVTASVPSMNVLVSVSLKVSVGGEEKGCASI